jgi:hypothetical protein
VLIVPPFKDRNVKNIVKVNFQLFVPISNKIHSDEVNEKCVSDIYQFTYNPIESACIVIF